jgi:PPK2 family polyphosphate:nucleotide phosphotransferase
MRDVLNGRIFAIVLDCLTAEHTNERIPVKKQLWNPSMDVPVNPQGLMVEQGKGLSLDMVVSRKGSDDDKKRYKSMLPLLQKEISKQVQKMYASRSHAVLIVLQAMDAAGKDSTIRRCFGPLNPQRCRTAGFVEPTRVEKRHDYLWRIHRRAPQRGTITVFNRSHYESVLVEKVKNLCLPDRLEKRYRSINDFERMLVDEGTVILKFYLHISKEYQKARLERRLRKESKRWKFAMSDVKERALWIDYQQAYETAFHRCSTAHAPWYIVPSERRWYRDMVIVSTLLNRLRALDLHFPEPEVSPETVTID